MTYEAKAIVSGVISVTATSSMDTEVREYVGNNTVVVKSGGATTEGSYDLYKLNKKLASRYDARSSDKTATVKDGASGA